MTRLAVVMLAAGLSGCAVAERLANGGLLEPSGAVVEPNGTVVEPNGVVVEPNGQVVQAAPTEPAIETVITAMSQAQTLRTLTRQLAR
jgi:hypothetical protein